MKKYLLTLITLTFFLCEASFTGAGMAFAAATQISGTDLTWDLTNGVLTIDYDGSGTGKQMPDYATGSSSPWYSSRANVTSIIIKDNVTKIGQNAFYSCSNATTVQISSDVITIGTDAFYGCSKLATINYRKNTMGSSTLTTTKQWSQITFANEKSNPLAANSSGGELWYVNSYYNQGMSYRLEKATSVMNLTGITSIKNYAFVGNKAITSVTLSPSITSIGTSAFKNCKALTTVNFGSNSSNLCNVESIGSSGFDGCTKISRVIVYGGLAKWLAISFGSNDANPFGDSTEETRQLYFDGTNDANKVTTLSLSVNTNSYAFFNNNTITSVSINENVTSIGNYAFKQCSALESLSLPSTLTTIGSDAFYDCNALTSYSYASDIEHWINIDFGSANSNPMNKVHKCFIGNSEQTSIDIPYGVSTIKARSFAGCTALTSVTLPVTLTSCGTGAFEGCSSVNLTNVDYLGSITDWCKINFANNTANPARYSGSLRINGVEQTDVYLEDDLVQIKNYAFYNNTALTRISINGSTSIAADALTGCSAELVLRGTVSGSCGSGVTWLLSDNGVLTISGTGAGTMTNYTNNTHAPWVAYKSIITQVVIEEGVTSIGNYAFNNCSNIRSISLPEGLQTIGNNAFNIGSFPYLTEIVIPSTVTTIGSYAFRLCGALEKVTVLATSPLTSITARTVGSSSGNNYYYDIFADAVFSTAALYVPISQLANYKAANGWKLFTHFHISGTCGAEGDNLIWDYDDNATTLTISGEGAMADYSGTNMPWNSFKTSISSLAVEDGVTTIGHYAFKGCTGISNLNTFPNSLEQIRYHAFENCTTLGSVTIPKNINKIGDGAFTGCSGLTTVTWNAEDCRTCLKSDGTDIPMSSSWNPFYGNNPRSNITSFAFEDDVRHIPSGLCASFTHNSFTEITIPAKITSMGTDVFKDCSKLRTVKWNATNCEDFTSSTAPFESIKSQITSFKFGYGVHHIPAYLCKGMTSMTGVTGGPVGMYIPTTVRSVGTDAFDGCSQFTRVNYKADNEYTITPIDKWVQIEFANAKANPLYYAHTLYVMVAPPSGSQSTPGLGELTNIVFSDTTTTIKPYAFVNDTHITSVTFGTSMANIGANAFNGCTGITEVHSNATSVPTLQSNCFPSAVLSSAKLYLPHSVSVKAAYRAASGWSSFTEANTFPKIVQFDLNGKTGDAPAPQFFDNTTSKASSPSNPADADYHSFSGWYEEPECENAFNFGSTNITEDKTLYANWTIYNYQVNFDLQGYGSSIPAQTIDHNGLVSKPDDPSAEYYIFGGWFKEPECSNEWNFTTDHVTSATTLYAKWTIIKYDVTFDLQDHGSSIPAQSIDRNGLVTEPSPTPTATGYTFGGWFKEAGCKNAWNFSEDQITAATTIYALWTINSYDVTFNLKGHGDPIAALSVNYNGTVTQPANPSAAGYTFSGWFKESSCTNAWNFSTDRISGDTTLYALWIDNVYSFAEADEDNSKIVAAEGKLALSITIQRTIWKDGYYNSLCLPFSLTAEQIAASALKDYKALKRLSAATVTGTGEERVLNIQLEPITEITAGEPCFISYEEGDNIDNPIFYHVTITASEAGSITKGDMTCYGTYCRTDLGTANTTLFLGENNTLYWPKEGKSTMKGLRAYFTVNTPSLAGLRVRLIDKPAEVPTGVEQTITNDQSPITNKIIIDNQLFIIRDGKTYNAQGALIK